MMKIEFWGAAKTVTGSMHLLHHNGKQLLLDCGLFQGKRKEAFERNRALPFDAAKIDAVVLSHAHIDHSGNLPSLVKSGFRGRIYSTSATRDLAVHLLLDCAQIQESDVRHVNKIRKAQGKSLFEPLYRNDDALETIRRFKCIEYGDPFSPVDGLNCEFHNAGHMLGAAVTSIDFEVSPAQKRRLVFSGDLGRPHMPILCDPLTVQDTDYVIMEATYGDRLHGKDDEAETSLKHIVDNTFARNGKLLIPAFSVGRTQEIVYRLNKLAESGQLPSLPVFVDSPLAVNATTVFREHVECLDDEYQHRITQEEDGDPLGFQNLHYIRKSVHSKELNNYPGPAIIISASGMCEGGRILHHLIHNIEKESTTLLFAGFQAPNTLGRQLLDGATSVNIFGQRRDVRCTVMRLESSSGHADQGELLNWLGEIATKGHLKNVALVHCEEPSAQALKLKIEQLNLADVIIPDRGESIELA
jgi:metallo-beta-lactamase family protein